MSTDSPAQRYHSMDAIRAFAMLMGIVFHSALSFIPADVGWAVIDRSPSFAATILIIVSHSFRMGLFFIIAGFFARLVYHRRGPAGFVLHRVQRILLPFIVGWFLVRPPIISGWIWGGMEPGEGGLPVAMAQALGFFFMTLELNEKLFTGTHLWFLYYLLLVYSAFLVLRGLVQLVDRDGALSRLGDRTIRGVLRLPMAIVLPAIPTVLFLWGMGKYGVDTPDQTLVPHLAVVAVYGFQFSLGWFLHRQPDRLADFTRYRWLHLSLAPVLAIPVVAFAIIDPSPEPWSSPWLQLAANGTYALMMWLWIFGFMGLFIRHFEKPSRAWRYVADSSYWLYIVHLPLIVWLQVAVADMNLAWPIKILLINGVTAPVLFVTYHFLVRSTFIGVALNGRRYPFRLPFVQSS